MEPQITKATGPSTFFILETSIDQFGREQARVQGPYGRTTMEVGRAHDDCEYEGVMLGSEEAWADIYYCSGCNYSIYYPLGD